MAVANYHDQHKRLPPPHLAAAAGRLAHSWRVLLLPYVEQRELHAAYVFTEPWDGPSNQALARRMPPTYAFPTEHRPGTTTANYLAVVGNETVWPGEAALTFKDVTDGPSNTILVVENDGANVPWLAPRDLAFRTMSLELNRPDGLSSPYVIPAVGMLDGSVRSLGTNLSPAALRALLTARGGEAVREDEGGWTVIPDGRQRELKPQ